jgi:hypothetical protein
MLEQVCQPVRILYIGLVPGYLPHMGGIDQHELKVADEPIINWTPEHSSTYLIMRGIRIVALLACK